MLLMEVAVVVVVVVVILIADQMCLSHISTKNEQIANVYVCK